MLKGATAPAPGLDSSIRILTHPQQDSKDTYEMPAARDRTQMPNWVMTAIVGILMVLLGFVYTTVDRRIEDKQREIDKLEIRLATQETYMKNTREQLIANGWKVDDAGNIRPPAKIKKGD